MKKTAIVLLSAALGCALWAGCSKSKPAPVGADGAGAGASTSTASAAAAPASGNTADMRVKWPVGTKYSMRMELVQSVETKVPNMPEPVVQKVNISQNFDIGAIRELPNGGRELEMQFKSQTLEVDQNGTEALKFDSSEPATQEPADSIKPLLRKMIGPKIYYTTTATGSVDKVEGVDAMMNQMGFNRKSQEQAMFKQLFSEETLKRYGEFGDMMPNREVKVGESWSVNRTIPTGVGDITTDMKYTFKKWDPQSGRRCALIATTGDLASAPGGTTATPIKIEKGKMGGDIWFDPELGMVVNENITEDMTLKVTAGTQNLTPQINQRIHISLLDVSH